MSTRTIRLFTVMGQAALIFTGICFLVNFALFLLLIPQSVRFNGPSRIPSTAEIITLMAFFIVPAASGSWWIFRNLQIDYQHRQALSAAIVFAVISPAPLIIGLVLGPIIGGYTSAFLGTESRIVAFSSAALGIVIIITLMTFIPSLIALWITRPCDSQQVNVQQD